jgi:hypothetical protein
MSTEEEEEEEDEKEKKKAVAPPRARRPWTLVASVTFVITLLVRSNIAPA